MGLDKLPKCEGVKGCEENGFIGWNGKWICGKCLAKIEAKKKEMENKLLEDLEE